MLVKCKYLRFCSVWEAITVYSNLLSVSSALRRLWRMPITSSVSHALFSWRFAASVERKKKSLFRKFLLSELTFCRFLHTILHSIYITVLFQTHMPLLFTQDDWFGQFQFWNCSMVHQIHSEDFTYSVCPFLKRTNPSRYSKNNLYKKESIIWNFLFHIHIM